MNQPPDPFEFLKSLWGPMGLPVPGSPALGLDQGEIDRQIAELKSVENWLNLNLSVLRATVHGLEMQRAGLAAVKESVGGVPNDAREAATGAQPGAGAGAARPARRRSPARPAGRTRK